MRMRMAGALVAPAFLLLTSCQPELHIAPASAEERIPRPRFTVAEAAGSGHAPRFHTVKVLNWEKAVVWHIRAEPFGDRNGFTPVAYGEAPPAFTTVTSARPLIPGETYSIVVIGTGYGSLRFRVGGDGRIRSLP